MLPPLMFSEEEIEALVLGSRWVADRGDARLGAAARNALAKITAVLPPGLREEADSSTLLVATGAPGVAGDTELPTIRQAIRAEHKLDITYVDVEGAETTRTIWPFALGFFDRVRVVAAWCELRQNFRSFRTDRILKLTPTETRYPRRRQALLKDWRAAEGISPS
jgi:predicted DNA-binding transcriptional regulator YafY